MVIDMVAPSFTKNNVSNTILGNNAYVMHMFTLNCMAHLGCTCWSRFGVYMSNFGGSWQEVTIIITAKQTKMDVLFFPKRALFPVLGCFFLKLDRISFKGS